MVLTMLCEIVTDGLWMKGIPMSMLVWIESRRILTYVGARSRVT